MIEEAQREEEEKKKTVPSASPFDGNATAIETEEKEKNEEEEEEEEDYSTLEEVTKELSLNQRPAWFDPQVFEKDDFNPDVYIDEMSPFVAPEDLAVEVEKYADELQNKLVEMVNRDYKDFVALTTDLVDVDAYVKEIKEPLEVLKGQVEDAREVVKQELEKLQNALDRRDELARERESLELIMEATTVCSKVERLLEEFRTSGDGDENGKKKSSKLTSTKAEFVAGDGSEEQEGIEDDGDESSVLVSTNVDIDMDLDGEGLEFLRPSKTFLASAERAERNASSSDNNASADENSALSPRKGDASSDATTSSSNNDRSDGHNSAEERARILSRVAGEVNRLKFFLSQGKDSQQVKALGDRVKSCDETLLKELNGAFAAALLDASEESKKAGISATKLKSAASVKFLLEAYQSVGRASDAEKTVKNTLVKPVVSAVTDSAPAPAGIGAREDVSGILKNCSEKAIEAVSFLLDIAKDLSSSESSCDFLGGSVLAEIDSQLHEKRPSSFSPGVPEAFISNYAASMAFIDDLQAKAETISQIAAEKFFDSDALRTFHKRWNLSVYFTLRFQEIAGDVDATLTRPGLERVQKGDATTPTAKSPKKDGTPKSPKSPKKQQEKQEINDVPGVFSLTASDAAFRSALRCFDDDVYVPAQADKFVRLAAQIVSRYRAWVSAGTEYLEETALINAAAEKSENTSDDAGGSSSVATAARRTTSSNTWGATAGCEELATVRSEVELFSKKVKEELVKVAAKKVGSAIKVPEDREAATNATSQCLELGAVTLDEFLPKITSAIALVVTERCTEALKQLKGITATFRMTNKPTPTKHSHFVPMLLQPLSKFCEESQRTRRLSPIAAKDLTREVCEGVTKKYAEMASDLVATVLKTEASLNRLKDRQGKGTTAASDATKAGGKLSDTDKIFKQLHLDVAEYASRLISVNVQPSSLEAFPALWKALAPEGEPIPA